MLDLAKGAGAFRSLSLRWHYRSRHEHLIAFSNHRFYGGDLVTFPSPTEQADDLGVALIQVEGVYRRGTTRDNPVEALRGRRARLRPRRARRPQHRRRRLQRGAGVAHRGGPAARPARARSFAELFTGDRLQSLFVKNLENVQGDERDIIIFSVGYGPDEHGKLTMNFGPLNREGGWRRLNVAITRARQRVEVICSFAPRAARAGSTTAGVDALRRYLDFAERGPAALAISDGSSGGEPETPVRGGRPAHAARHGATTSIAQVGTAGYRIDLAVRHPDQPGRSRSGSSATARCTTPRASPAIATGCASRCSAGSAGRCTASGARAGTATARARSGGSRRRSSARCSRRRPCSRSRAAARPIDVDFEDLELDAPPPWAEPYVAATLPPGRAFDLTEPSAAAEVRQLVLHTVTEEAPIVEDLLARRVVDAWGGVLSEKRRGAVRRAVDGARAQRDARPPRQRVRAPEPAHRPRARPVGDDPRSQREVKHVPDVELAEAIAAARRATPGSSPRRRPSSAPRGSSAGRARARRSRRR